MARPAPATKAEPAARFNADFREGESLLREKPVLTKPALSDAFAQQRSVVLAARGEYARAQWCLREGLRQLEGAYGNRSLALAVCHSDLASVAVAAGDPDAAEEHLRRALEIRQRACGADHPLVAETLWELAAVHFEQNRRDAAKQVLDEALTMSRKSLANDKPRLVRHLRECEEVLKGAGLQQDARRLEAEIESLLPLEETGPAPFSEFMPLAAKLPSRENK